MEVGQKKPNELGLYDMSGNVREWCQDATVRYLAGHMSNKNPCQLPPGPSGKVRREIDMKELLKNQMVMPVVKGGCWQLFKYECAIDVRNITTYATSAFAINGFRIAISRS